MQKKRSKNSRAFSVCTAPGMSLTPRDRSLSQMAGSTSSMEAAERMLNIASVEPLLNQTVSDLDPQALSQTRRPYARAFF